MELFNNEMFSPKEKQVIYSLLEGVMEADGKRKKEELSFLERMKKALSMTDEQVNGLEKPSKDECKEVLYSFNDEQRAEVKDSLMKMAWADGEYVPQEKELIESLKLDISHHELELIAEWRDEQQKVVGFYTQKEKGHFRIEDIRSLGFSELKYKDDEEVAIEVEEIPDLSPNKYYEFLWTTESDESDRGFHVVPRDYKFKEVKAKELVDRLYNNWKSKDYDTIRQMSEVQKMVNTQLTASSDGTFIYELLQNANDYPEIKDNRVQLVDVEFHITDHYLIYRHTGRLFSPRNIAAISKMSDGEKKKEKNAIGYKGIGFKTVFSENQYVYLRSGEYSLRFDESVTKKGLGSSKFPWQLMPIWTPQDEVDDEVNDAMKDASDFRVQMAIRPNDKSKLRVGDKSFEFIFNDIFKDEKDILFIPNIKSVRVFYDGKEKILRTKDSQKWVLTEEPLVYKFTEDEIEENNREVAANKRIPEKYKDFVDTRVSFACQRDREVLKPVEKARVYCYLPTQVSLGFPFLMNTDMIPTGPRDDFEKKVAFNHKIMKIAGGKFAEWICDLLHYGKYDICSVFTIIPSFEKVVNYEDFIDEFKEGFDNRLDDLELIPCENGRFSLVSDTIIDKTGLLSSGVLSDDEFLGFSGRKGSLPAKELRTNQEFNSFVKKYVDSSKIFDTNALHKIIRGDQFKNWLKNQENNNKFLKFLLEKDLLKGFFNEKIFLDDEDSLQKAKALYYDVDKYLVDLQAFTKYIDFLSPKTREFFKDSEKWKELIDGKFAKFVCENFVNNVLLSCENKASTIESLKNKDTSIHFFKFLAENITFNDNFKSLPFIADDGTIVDDFKINFCFFTSEKGHDVCKSEWMSSIAVAFVSSDYTKTTKDYLKNNFGVQAFSDKIIVENIILSEDYHDDINDSINDDFPTSKEFVLYCFAHKKFFERGSLRNYALHTFDGNGDEAWCLAEDHIYFQSDLYEKFAVKEWVDNDWMYVLDESYMDGVGESSGLKAFKAFVKKAFKVGELTKKNFYTDIVKPHLKSEFFKTISGTNDGGGPKNLDFIRYLDNNYKLIFKEKNDGNLFSGIEVVTNCVSDVNVGEPNLYIYDEELKSITDADWFPDNLVLMCHPAYEKSKALLKLGVKPFKFNDFYDTIIAELIKDINNGVSNKDQSIAFHKFVIDHIGDLNPKQLEKMRNASVFLYGQDKASKTSGGHKILSSTAKKLFGMGLVEFSDLDIIDPDYKPETNPEYWETRLGNTEYTVNHFFTWLEGNEETFCETLQNEELNVKFWRWVKNNSLESHLSGIPALPVLLKDSSFGSSVDAVYFSDEYMDGAGVEHLVQEYDDQALFISPNYIEEDGSVENWKKFWTTIGVKFEIVDILVKTVIPKLANIEDEHLPRLLAENRESLEKQYEENELVAQLSKLRVKGLDGKFYSINEAIYIDCEKDEPFPYIKLPNQISYPSAEDEERRLIKDVIKEVEGDCVKTLSEWRQRKIDCYLSMQEKDENSIRSFHYELINDLSIIRNGNQDSLKEIKGIENILLLNKKGKFCKASSLTMGSVYRPFFDFEKCGIESLEYVCDSYATKCSEYVGKLFRTLEVHCDFQEDDVALLEKRECSIYFWQTYLTKKGDSISRIKDIVNGNLLGDLKCIPTKDCMKKPSELYYGSDVSRYVKAIEDWENKIPLSSLPEIKLPDGTTLFGKLPFNGSLGFLDALYALVSVLGQERRTQLLNWMIDSYDESYNKKIEEYRNDKQALWKNNKNVDVQIRDLYALDYRTKALDQYFGSNPYIINKAYFPTGDSFKKACDMLGIKTITSDDLKMEPVNASVYHDRDTNHKIYALVISGMCDADNWQELYKGYCLKLNKLVMHKCESIMITYKDDENINQTLKKFYHKEEDNNFYFVESLDGKRVFKSFVEEFVNFLGIDTDKIAEDVIEDIMDSRENALEFVKEQNNLMLDESFKDELNHLVPGIKCNLSGNEADDNEDEEPPIRPSFTTTEPNYNDKKEYVEGEDETSDSENKPASNSLSQTQSPQQSYGMNTQTCSAQTDDEDGISDYDGGVRGEPDTKNRTTSKCGQSQGGTRHNWANWPNSEPTVYAEKDIDRIKSKGVARCLSEGDAEPIEIEQINTLLGSNMTAEEIADTNYLAQMRLYQSLKKNGDEPKEKEENFIKSKNVEHYLSSGKYIHKCSAKYGIVYISPSIWNKVKSGKCIICVYLGKRAKDFMYLRSIEDILKWVHEDDILIKLTGEEKAEVVEALYSGVLDGISGTAYTMIRVASNANYNPVFAQLEDNPDQEDSVDDFPDL